MVKATNLATAFCPADRLEALLARRMQKVGRDGDNPAEQALNLGGETPCFWHLSRLASSQSKPENSMLLDPASQYHLYRQLHT
jgi:hypothetical protein